MDDEWNEWTVICIVGCGRPKVDHQTPRFLSKETWTSIKIYDTLCILYNVDIQNDFLPLIYLLYCIVMAYILQSTSQIHYTIRPQYNKQQKRWQNAHVNKISQTWKQNMFWKNVDLLEVFLGGRIPPLSMANDGRFPGLEPFMKSVCHWTCIPLKITQLGGGFKYFLLSPLPGEMIQFDYYFSNGLKPPTRQTVMKDFCLIKCSSPHNQMHLWDSFPGNSTWSPGSMVF